MARYKGKRCACGKIIYLTMEEARLAIRGIPLHRQYHLLKPYRCELGKLHVGHDHKMYDRLVRPAEG
jgi:hypothetical protein